MGHSGVAGNPSTQKNGASSEIRRPEKVRNQKANGRRIRDSKNNEETRWAPEKVRVG